MNNRCGHVANVSPIVVRFELEKIESHIVHFLYLVGKYIPWNVKSFSNEFIDSIFSIIIILRWNNK